MEIASFDPFLSSGMNLSYAGTHLVAGRSADGTSCVTGFDQAGFIMGSSASLFNVKFCLCNVVINVNSLLADSNSWTLPIILLPNSQTAIVPAYSTCCHANSRKFEQEQMMLPTGQTHSKALIWLIFKIGMHPGWNWLMELLIKKIFPLVLWLFEPGHWMSLSPLKVVLMI